MEGEGRELPEELLEMIVARMPFPSLFKARVLSKGWNSKFLPEVPFMPQLESSSKSSSFQSEVSRNTAKWATSAPLSFHPAKMALLIFDRVASEWLPPVTLSCYIPTEETERWSSEHCAGAFVLFELHGLHCFNKGVPEVPHELFISNILTRNCMKLMVPPPLGSRLDGFDCPGPDYLCLVAVGCCSYKVIAVYFVKDAEQRNRVCFHIYESKSHTWTSKLLVVRGYDYFHQNYAYMDGKLYLVACHVDEDGYYSLKLCSYHLEENTWSVLHEELEDACYDATNCGVLRCGDKVIVVFSNADKLFAESLQGIDEEDALEKYSFLYTESGFMFVFQLDLQSLKLVMLSGGPPEVMVVLGNSKLGGFQDDISFSSDVNSVYFSRKSFQGSMIRFDLSYLKWSWTPPPSYTNDSDKNEDGAMLVHGAFEPGLNTFASA